MIADLEVTENFIKMLVSNFSEFNYFYNLISNTKVVYEQSECVKPCRTLGYLKLILLT